MVLVALGVAAFAFLARVDADALRPIIDMPEGVYVYHQALTQAATSIALAEGALLVIVAVAAYSMALVSTRPLREARERERRFASEAAHELRTPLARIATLAQAARGGSDDERARALDSVAKMSLDASALIGDLLTLARVEHVHSSLYEPVDLASLVRDVAAAFTATQAEKRIVVNAPDGTFVSGDALRLHRMIANLVDNAVRHAATRVQIDVERAGARALVIVEDDGRGVDEELREQIFERFVTTTTGTGLGLPICRWIARAHGGDIRVTDRSRFVVNLPAVSAQD